MDAFLDYFQNLSNGQKFVWVFICLGFTTLLEIGFPLVKFNYKKIKHLGVNLVFLSTTLIISALFGLATVGVFNWSEVNNIGLLQWIDLPIWIELLIAVLFLDLIAQYFVHYLLHKVSFMWKFHMIHHSDTTVDASTGTRHHPGDYFFRELFSLFAIVICGMPLAFYMLYRIITVFCTYITHANIVVPSWLDKTLSLVFITPNMHKFHHHFERPWTDTNFGNIFSIWDRVFGTFVYDDPHKVKYGLDVLQDSLDQNIGYQMKIPFDKSIKTDY
jgi:sterol desaturase/sphingolipid hydroxylase (fatty acid hydroxylase superfamily)